jgi:MFS superfamily sulfate permease-like transporter
MHDGPRTDYNKELRAQGVGNLLCGLAGALPMTGVIVRSSANVQAGARTRLSAVLHGAWILGLVALVPGLLREVPMAALGGVLVVTGWRLVSLSHARHLLRHYGALPAAIWAATFATVVTVDLLTGVLVGLALSALELVPHGKSLKLTVNETHDHDRSSVRLDGAATFLSLTRLLAALDRVPAGRPVHLDLRGLRGIDHTAAEMVKQWLGRRRRAGARIDLSGSPDLLGRLAPAGH